MDKYKKINWNWFHTSLKVSNHQGLKINLDSMNRNSLLKIISKCSKMKIKSLIQHNNMMKKKESYLINCKIKMWA